LQDISYQILQRRNSLSVSGRHAVERRAFDACASLCQDDAQMSPSAIDVVSADARPAALSARQSLKMARSAHAYVRGNTLRFYEWLHQRGPHDIPKGAAVWICGDCHLGNLGPVANADGQVEIQIRDLDQAVIGNPAHDLIRLAMSLATAARGSDLPGLTTADMLEQMMAGYQQALSHRRSAAALGPKPESVRIVMKRAMNRTWKHLARERIEDVTPTIPLGERFWPLSKPEGKQIKLLFAEPEVRALVTSLKSRKSGAKIKVLDAAYWMKGCSSLATALCGAAGSRQGIQAGRFLPDRYQGGRGRRGTPVFRALRCRAIRPSGWCRELGRCPLTWANGCCRSRSWDDRHSFASCCRRTSSSRSTN
jgi:hypothetical protein